MSCLDSKVRDLVLKHGNIWIEHLVDTDDVEINNQKEEVMERILNDISFDKKTEVVSKAIVEEMVVFITSFCAKKYTVAQLEEGFLQMIDMAYFPDYQRSLSKAELIGVIDWDGVFATMATDYYFNNYKGVLID